MVVGLPVPPAVVGLLQYGAVAALPLAAAWLLLHADLLRRGGTRLARGLHLVTPPAPVTFAPPLERIAADLRRLSRSLRTVPAGTPKVRRVGLVLAYDDVLIDACRALGVQQSLQAYGLGMVRDVERLRVEVELERAGLWFREEDAA